MLLKSIHALSDPAEFLQYDAQITPGSTTQTHNIVLFSHFNLKLKLGLVSGLSLQKHRLRPFQAFGGGGRRAGGAGGGLSGGLSVSSEGCLRTWGSSCP